MPEVSEDNINKKIKLPWPNGEVTKEELKGKHFTLPCLTVCKSVLFFMAATGFIGFTIWVIIGTVVVKDGYYSGRECYAIVHCKVESAEHVAFWNTVYGYIWKAEGVMVGITVLFAILALFNYNEYKWI